MIRVRFVVALVLACVAVLVGVSCTQTAAPCTPGDTVMAAHALECAARVHAECKNVPDSECPAIKDCDAWGEARCGLGRDASADTGAAGAP